MLCVLPLFFAYSHNYFLSSVLLLDSANISRSVSLPCDSSVGHSLSSACLFPLEKQGPGKRVWFTAAAPSAGISLWVQWTNDSVGSVVRSCSDTHVEATGLKAEKVEGVRLWLLAHSSPLSALHGALVFSVQARLLMAFGVKSELPQGLQDQTVPTSPALTLTIPPLPTTWLPQNLKGSFTSRSFLEGLIACLFFLSDCSYILSISFITCQFVLARYA